MLVGRSEHQEAMKTSIFTTHDGQCRPGTVSFVVKSVVRKGGIMIDIVKERKEPIS